MASTKISDMTAATDLTGAVIPIVQGGVNKKAASTLFGSGSVDDTAYDATSWNGETTTAPSKNAVRDKIETLAPLASPALTGNPTAPTQTVGDNSTKIATTAYVENSINALSTSVGNKIFLYNNFI